MSQLKVKFRSLNILKIYHETQPIATSIHRIFNYNTLESLHHFVSNTLPLKLTLFSIRIKQFQNNHIKTSFYSGSNKTPYNNHPNRQKFVQLCKALNNYRRAQRRTVLLPRTASKSWRDSLPARYYAPAPFRARLMARFRFK